MFAAQHAAVIGINAYGRGLAPLKTAVADARAFADVLARDHRYASPHLLLDGEATGTAILRLLEETLPAAVEAESAVVLYYAGHGQALSDGQEGPKGFLLPQDAQRGDMSTWLSMERVRKALSHLPCRHLLVVLDCCFAGSFRWATSRSSVPMFLPLYDSQYARFLAGTAWQVLTSASHQEPAKDELPGCRNTRDGEASNGHSPFAAALFKGLAGEADSSRGSHEPDGVITATELHQFIYEEMVPPGTRSRQTPGLWPLKPENKGEFLFLVPGRERKTQPDPPLNDAHNPWLGLQAYGRKDAPLFFGRERVVAEILGRIRDPARPPLLAVVGASGTGKSSVVRAGVLPRLEATPGGQAQRSGAWTVARLPRLQSDPRPQLDEALQKLAKTPTGQRKLLFIDQFEELYTQCPDGEIRADFLRRLRKLMDSEDPLKVVLTLRSDFEPRLAASEELGELLAPARYPVPAMTSEELREVIEEPAKLKALYFEPAALVGELVDEVMAMPGGLPLLSFALSEMYRQAQLRRRETGALDRDLTRADYKAAGGVVGALHRRANELYEAAAADPPRRETIRRLFLRLVSQEGGRLARRRVEKRELEYADPDEQERVRQVLDEYVAARLLVADGGYVEPAHDTLVLAWEKLLGWLTESGSQELLRQLWGAASAWEAARRDGSEKKARGLLWNQDPRLPLVQDRYLGSSGSWLARLRSHVPAGTPAHPGELNGIERKFAERSVSHKQSRRNLFAGITAAVIFVLSGATWISLDWASEARLAAAAEKSASAIAESRRIEAEQERGKAQAKQKEAEDARAVADRSAIAERRAKERAEKAAAAEREAKKDAEKKRGEAEAAAVAERLARQKAQDTARVAVAGELLERDPTRAALVLLEVARPAETVYFEARLREALLGPVSEAVLRGHTQWVVDAVFSPDGKRVATASRDQTARVWAADGSAEPIVLRGHDNVVESVAFSPDGRRVVTAGDKTARVWMADGSGEPVVLRGHERWVNRAVFSPDGTRVVTASDDGTAQVWMADGSGKPVVLQGHLKAVVSAAFSPDGRRIVTASEDGTARVWAADGSGEAVVLRGHQDVLKSAAFSPDGRYVVTASWDKTARVWPADGSGRAVILRGHKGGLLSAAFSADGGRVITASADGTAGVWAADGAGRAVVLSGHEGPVRNAAFSPDGRRVVTASEDATARLWAADGSGEPVVFRSHDRDVRSAVFSPDGKRIVTASHDTTARVWATDGSGEPVVLPVHDEPVVPRGQVGLTVEDFSPDGTRVVLTSSHDMNAVRVWTADGSGERVVLRHTEWVTDAAFSPDGRRIVTASADHTARVWSADGSGKPVVLGHDSKVDSAAFSPDGTRIVTASSDANVRVWLADGSGEPVVLRGHKGGVNSAAFSPDGKRVLTTSVDKIVRVWSADGSGEPMILRHDFEVWSAAFSPDGRRVATASLDTMTRVWSADGAGEPVVLRGHSDSVNTVAFSPDGTRVVTASADGTARVWSADGTGEPVVLRGHSNNVFKAAFSLDGRRVLTVSDDGTARLWAADGSGDLVTFSSVENAYFSSDGTRILTSENNAVRIWVVGATMLQALTRKATPACLEPDFHVTYLGEPKAEAAAAYDRCRRCVGPWRRKFDLRSIRAAPAKAWSEWQRCMGR